MKHGSNPNPKRSRSRGGGGGKRYSPSKNQGYESNGPEVKVRGTAQQVLEKYLSLARDASSSGDRVNAESYLQHAEHYYRVLGAAQAQDQESGQNRPRYGEGGMMPAGERAEGQGEFPISAMDSPQPDLEAPIQEAPALAPSRRARSNAAGPHKKSGVTTV